MLLSPAHQAPGCLRGGGVCSTLHHAPLPAAAVRRTRHLACRAQDDSKVSRADNQVRLRSEVEAPWRTVRFGIFGFSIVSAGVGLIVNLPQLIGAVGGAANAFEVGQITQNIGINLGVVVVCALLLKRDLDARDKQMARLGREEALAKLALSLANGKRTQVGSLRGFARVVVCAGTNTQVGEAMAAAAPFKEDLLKRGVLVVPAPIYESPGAPTGDALPPPTPDDLRWQANPQNLDSWREWFQTQLSMSSKAKPDTGLYLSLRKDGRVRSSGMGSPPWGLLVAQLPQEDGLFKGFLDGMDGRV